MEEKEKKNGTPFDWMKWLCTKCSRLFVLRNSRTNYMIKLLKFISQAKKIRIIFHVLRNSLRIFPSLKVYIGENLGIFPSPRTYIAGGGSRGFVKVPGSLCKFLTYSFIFSTYSLQSTYREIFPSLNLGAGCKGSLPNFGERCSAGQKT